MRFPWQKSGLVKVASQPIHRITAHATVAGQRLRFGIVGFDRPTKGEVEARLRQRFGADLEAVSLGGAA